MDVGCGMWQKLTYEQGWCWIVETWTACVAESEWGFGNKDAATCWCEGIYKMGGEGVALPFSKWVVAFGGSSDKLMFGVVAIQHNVAGKLDIMMIVWANGKLLVPHLHWYAKRKNMCHGWHDFAWRYLAHFLLLVIWVLDMGLVQHYNKLHTSLFDVMFFMNRNF
jgi:hypothetical protein